MATADLSGLFGGNLTPEEQQRQLTEARAAQFANLAPSQQLAFMGYKAGTNLGQGLAQAAGVDIQDPAIKRATQLRQLAQGVDVTSIEGLKQYAQRLQQAGFVAEANQLGGQIQSLMESQSKQFQQTAAGQASLAAAGKSKFDVSAAGKAIELAKTGKYTSESITDYLSGKGELVSLDKMVKPSSEFIAIANELGYGDKAKYGDYTPEQTANINAELQKRDIAKKIAGANRMSVIQQQESSFAKQRGEYQAKALSEAESQAKGSAAALDRLGTMESKNKGDMITGPLAGTAIGAGQFLSSIGLLTPKAAATLANSEVYDKSAKDLVMQDLEGKLGGGISNADRDYIEARIPQLKNSQQARTELIAKLKEIHSKRITYYKDMSAYANKNNNLNGFDFAMQAPTQAGTKANPIKLD
jgi:hypothetical protein